jgi:hypothetical protein
LIGRDLSTISIFLVTLPIYLVFMRWARVAVSATIVVGTMIYLRKNRCDTLVTA